MGEGARVGEIERRKKILEAMTYVRNNLDWIANIPKVKGYGSGPVEKTVDITVARRLKKRGMHWHRSGARDRPLMGEPFGMWDIRSVNEFGSGWKRLGDGSRRLEDLERAILYLT
jgi:hypothetical protein